MLVAGGAGYIGSIISRRMLEAGHDVVILDDLRTGHRDAVPDVEFHELPLSRVGEVLDDTVEVVIHLAASALVAESVAHPARYWSNNLVEGLALLEAMRTSGVGSIIFSSTCAVYGEPRTLPITEQTVTEPVNAYGATKLAMDMALSSYARAYDMAAASFRYFNVAGAYGDLHERHDPETHLIPNLLRGLEGTPVTIFGTDFPTRDGTAIRDYIHVLDLADAHQLALDVLAPGTHHIVNLGTGTGQTVREVLDAVRRVTGSDLQVLEAARRPGDPPELVADHRWATELLGWTPGRDLDTAIRDAWEAR